MKGNTLHMTKSILFCYAHPDDEIGIIALANRYMREEGARTTLICTTNGDVGTVDPEHMQSYASIAELRLAELACATKAAGFNEVVTFDYRDSGMMGTADNDHPECSWQAPLEVVTQRVVEVMRRVRPQVAITFNTFGAYGHPDHIKINQATLAAFQQLQSEPDHPQKLYYATGPGRLFRIGVTIMRLRGQDPRKGGRNKDVDLVAALEAITPVTTKIKAAKYLDPTWKALNCYGSQIQLPPIARRFRKLLGPLLQGTTALSRVYPAWHPGERIERDLFENVTFSPQLQPSEA
jgi:LmbE family N-acetylglucosaminyl deacetylase